MPFQPTSEDIRVLVKLWLPHLDHIYSGKVSGCAHCEVAPTSVEAWQAHQSHDALTWGCPYCYTPVETLRMWCSACHDCTFVWWDTSYGRHCLKCEPRQKPGRVEFLEFTAFVSFSRS